MNYDDSGNLVDVRRPRRFRLVRHVDSTGVSGTGHVADGVEFVDGCVVLRWRTKTPSTAVYEDMQSMQIVHGHEGKTRVEYFDR